jgi:glucose/arabinose dehydrogenase
MRSSSILLAGFPALLLSGIAGGVLAQSGSAGPDVLRSKAAFGNWRSDRPGVRRYITPSDMPAPDLSASAALEARIVRRRDDQRPNVPQGFQVALFASGLDEPRRLRVAPNGDVFVSESASGRIHALRASATPARPLRETFASRLREPFGIAFYPPGPNPEWLYIANIDSVVRFPYRTGDLKARGKPEVIVARLPARRGHITRDIAFSADGTKMFVSVGSASNAGENLRRLAPAVLQHWISEHPLGAAWGAETERADLLEFDPQGHGRRIFATGLRNCVTMAIASGSGELWCSTNERDALGDDVPPDYVTRVRGGAFYGWPWYYIGGNEDPRLRGQRPDLEDKVTVPDVLIAAHSASLGMTFYDGTQFPAEYRGHIFAAQHGSWNRSKLTGYKVIRIPVQDGTPTGEYEDFMTGFAVSDTEVWGRPVGIAVAQDGSLLVSEDGNGTIWQVSYR